MDQPLLSEGQPLLVSLAVLEGLLNKVALRLQSSRSATTSVELLFELG